MKHLNFYGRAFNEANPAIVDGENENSSENNTPAEKKQPWIKSKEGILTVAGVGGAAVLITGVVVGRKLYKKRKETPQQAFGQQEAPTQNATAQNQQPKDKKQDNFEPVK